MWSARRADATQLGSFGLSLELSARYLGTSHVAVPCLGSPQSQPWTEELTSHWGSEKRKVNTQYRAA